MKKLKLGVVIVLCALSSAALSQVTTQANGNYTNNGTWIGSAPNALVDDVLIVHDVTLNTNIEIRQVFTVQAPGSLTSTTKSIEVTSAGSFVIGNLNTSDKVQVEDDASMTILAGDTVYIEDLVIKNDASLFIESGAVVYVTNDFKVINDASAIIDGKVFVTDKFEVKNAAVITGSGSVCAGTKVKINGSATVFGSSEECPGCIYTNGCTLGTVANVWDGSKNTDWFDNANWSDNVPTQKDPVIIPAGMPNYPVISAAGAETFDLTIESGGSLTISAGIQIDIHGNMNVQGSFIPNTSIVNFASPCWDSELDAAGTVQFYNLSINGPSQVTIKTGNFELNGTLTVATGSLETNNLLTLKSTAVGTARIAEITGVGITGEIMMERYIDAGETFWRYFGSAVQGATLAQFNDDFTTAGYPGSLYPSFPWISAYNYDETMGAGLGYLPTTGASQVMGIGEGWQIWCGDTITGTQPFTFDLRGVPNQGNISMPVTFTNTGNPAEDGFNLVSNPYASTIDWDDADWTKSNMANAVYIQNPDNQQYATYVAGASTNGGSRYIASQQAFWVQAFAASPVLTATEGVKSTVDQAFIKNGNQNTPGMTITLQGHSQFDEAVLRHLPGATDDFDYEWDAVKYWGGWGDYPQLSAINGQQKDLTVHSFENMNQEISVPLRAIVFQDGVYALSFEHISEMDVPCMILEDTYDGSIYPITEGASFEFFLDDTTYAPRFVVHIGRKYDQFTTQVSCFGGSDGQIELDLDIPLLTDFDLITGVSSTSMNASADPIVVGGLPQGIYQISVPTLTNLCGQTVFNFVVNEPAPMVNNAVIVDEIYGEDGSIFLNVSGGVPPYTYLWGNGMVYSALENLSPGDYSVQITDAKSCVLTENFLINSFLSLSDEDAITQPFFNQEDKCIYINNLISDGCDTFSLFDIHGQLVQSFTANQILSQKLSVDKALPSGIYVLNGSCINFKFYLNK